MSSEKVRMQQAMQEKQKYDLSKWRYSELRDTINTSRDIELLEACRHEFHRRLKVCHAWKAKNQKRTTMGESERAPKSIMDAAGVDDMQMYETGLARKCGTEILELESILERKNQEGLLYQSPSDHHKPEKVKMDQEIASETISISSDIEFFEVYRHEFHGRLKDYHAWKKNQKTTIVEESERAPKSILDAAGAQHRYFKIPFVRATAEGEAISSSNEKQGWWYAHFDGLYAVRQMELHPDKQPVLICEGENDLEMCELSLHETGLTRRYGAEIMELEFNLQWKNQGGSPYKSLADRG